MRQDLEIIKLYFMFNLKKIHVRYYFGHVLIELRENKIVYCWVSK